MLGRLAEARAHEDEIEVGRAYSTLGDCHRIPPGHRDLTVIVIGSLRQEATVIPLRDFCLGSFEQGCLRQPRANQPFRGIR